ncbi:EEF1A lysine methyltransferase 4 isoform X2 [Carcharodon carcharias]|uniref:EEF1A lysine methyltransferase 4 isoform X2 n=1 Tax=Carcharodon carcharias TaxID=13397 RepID=UPI001B7DD9D3|nr:EEF1A lysine methyltransferase 4 isoform X2 [Carcharodon carcharias]
MDHSPSSHLRYKDRDYWDERYRHEETFEWFGAFSRFEHLLKEEIRGDEAILILGCGNSSMSYDMFMSGYRSITNIDFSATCIEKMASKYASCSGMEWKIMDAKALEFENESFDVVLEKGTLDAMMVDETDPWNVSQETKENIDQVLKEDQLQRWNRMSQPSRRWSTQRGEMVQTLHHYIIPLHLPSAQTHPPQLGINQD